ncbi:hypothetical protein GNZ12_02100 [Paraburkholderia sp. 1N]|uniref:Uncharacterized protein n=1 Tax=Paraburkholderia solitsugae TaxID=2675748 RepID=A0ABX2BGR7_9BURK|nr:hypothetical protein [Paraburkholderia solitsugae]NPT40134.1 hypothetical protein [Paraburkholderia solitsugae]
MTPMQQHTISAKPKRIPFFADAWGEGMTPMQQRTISAEANFVRKAREVKRSGRSQNEFLFLLMRGGKV